MGWPHGVGEKWLVLDGMEGEAKGFVHTVNVGCADGEAPPYQGWGSGWFGRNPHGVEQVVREEGGSLPWAAPADSSPFPLGLGRQQPPTTPAVGSFPMSLWDIMPTWWVSVLSPTHLGGNVALFSFQ